MIRFSRVTGAMVWLFVSQALLWAGPPGTWTKMSTSPVGSSDVAALLRTPDGVLHVVWGRNVGSKRGLGHTAITAAGTLSRPMTVISGWGGIHYDPKLVPYGTGLRLVFSGLRSTSSDPYSSGAIFTATSPTGAKWTLGTGALSQSGYGYASAGTGATAQLDGTPIASWTWGTASTMFYHVGIDTTIPATKPDQKFELPNCCNVGSALATDPVSGAVWLAWYSGGTAANNGYMARPLLPKLGPKKRAPSSSVNGTSIAPSQDVALCARTGGGVYLAYGQGYPSILRVGVWKLGSSVVRTVPDSAGASQVVLSAGADGRLWVLWFANNSLYAALSDVDVTTFSTIATIPLPPNTAQVYTVSGEGSMGTLDIIINVLAWDGKHSFWHTEVASD